jgi:putative transposase
MSTIKNEFVNRYRFKTRNQARLPVFSLIEDSYDDHRRHSALGYRSPMDYEKMWAQRGDSACDE